MAQDQGRGGWGELRPHIVAKDTGEHGVGARAAHEHGTDTAVSDGGNFVGGAIFQIVVNHHLPIRLGQLIDRLAQDAL